MLLAVALGGEFYLENPHNSLICMYPRYVWFVERLMELGIPEPPWHSWYNLLFLLIIYCNTWALGINQYALKILCH